MMNMNQNHNNCNKIINHQVIVTTFILFGLELDYDALIGLFSCDDEDGGDVLERREECDCDGFDVIFDQRESSHNFI